MILVASWVSQLPLLGVRALAGGLFVVLFALISEALQPKMFSGLFGAAPSVALASLLVGALSRGPAQVLPDAYGMLLGAAGMVAYCVAAALLLPRLGALAGSLLAWGAWFAAAVGVYLAVVG